MRTVRAKLKSTTPLSFSRGFDPKAHPGPDGETKDEEENRLWKLRLHVNGSGKIFIPPNAITKTIHNAAARRGDKIVGKGQRTWTKHFISGVQVVEPLVLPYGPDDVERERLFVPSDGKSGGGSRVWRNFPTLPEWQGVAQFEIFDPEIPNAIFETTLRDSGLFIGFLRFRPQKGGYYGRFTVEEIEWSEN